MPVNKYDHVIRTRDKSKVVVSFASGYVPRPLHHLIKLVQVKVRQQWRDDATLRHSLLPVCFEYEFQKMHDVVILHPPGDLLQQKMMSYVVEVSAQVYVYYSCQPMQYPGSHSIDCLMCMTLRSVAVRAFLEISLEYWFEYKFQRSLYNTILYSRYPKGAGLSVSLRDINPSVWHRLVPPGLKFLPYLFQKSFNAFGFDIFKALSIDAGRSIVGLCQSIGFFKDFFLADMTVKSPKPPVLLGLRLPVYLSPQFLQSHGSFYYSPLPC